VIDVHKNDADPWPSKPHGHIYDKNQVVDEDGTIYNKQTGEKVGQLSKKGRKAWHKFLRGKGFLSICVGIALIPNYSPEDAIADLLMIGDAE
jgi:hypothetical protein